MSDQVAAHFEQQALACEKMGSPFTAAVCRSVWRMLGDDTVSGRIVRRWPGNPRDDALALRVTGALHALVLDNADAGLVAAYPPNAVDGDRLRKAVGEAVRAHDRRIADTITNAPQTNETQRSAVLLPGLLAVARETGWPLALHEIGSSAGLNLYMDRFRYDYAGAVWGDPDYPVVLKPELRGETPNLDGGLAIASRTGNDIAPIDVGVAEDRLRLRSYIWPDQPRRLERLDAAISLALDHPPQIVAGDAAAFVASQLARHAENTCFVLFHSVVWQYLPQIARTGIKQAMHAAGEAASAQKPVAWLSMEGLGGVDPHAVLRLTVWPGGETRILASCDWHGRRIEWL